MDTWKIHDINTRDKIQEDTWKIQDIKDTWNLGHKLSSKSVTFEFYV